MREVHAGSETVSTWGKRHGLPGYDSFRCGLTFQQAFDMLKDNSDDPRNWRYKRRSTVLGFLHQWKLEHYERAVEAGYLETIGDDGVAGKHRSVPAVRSANRNKRNRRTTPARGKLPAVEQTTAIRNVRRHSSRKMAG